MDEFDWKVVGMMEYIIIKTKLATEQQLISFYAREPKIIKY